MKEHKTKSIRDCSHIGSVRFTESEKTKCQDCDATTDLRLCTSCGAVYCSESGNGHDTLHFKETGHPVILPVHADYTWIWCYECEAYLK